MPDLFSESVIRNAFYRSDGECECTNNYHKHSGRCSSLIIYNMRGMELPGGWEVYRTDADNPPVISNCRIICIDCFTADKR
jgi:hypothetical protein